MTERSGEVEVFVEGGEEVADAAVVAGFTGGAVQDEDGRQPMHGIGKGNGRLLAAVAEGVG